MACIAPAPSGRAVSAIQPSNVEGSIPEASGGAPRAAISFRPSGPKVTLVTPWSRRPFVMISCGPWVLGRASCDQRCFMMCVRFLKHKHNLGINLLWASAWPCRRPTSAQGA